MVPDQMKLNTKYVLYWCLLKMCILITPIYFIITILAYYVYLTTFKIIINVILILNLNTHKLNLYMLNYDYCH